MPEASIVHDGYGFRCARLERALPLALGLDGSAVLENPGALPEGWLVAALDQLFIAAPALTG
ncbi:acetyltransferase, partial [Cronobacter dublinensis subsp. dublinensis]|nr:acetyltransferase [Cronobacter dublinensis subsp. dublinensis]